MGTDFSNNGQVGLDIHAAMGGVVVRAGESSGYGQAMYVLQDDGTVAVYGHVDPAVWSGRVNANDVIAHTSAWCPGCSAPHLHFEIHTDGNLYDDNHKIDSAAWLSQHGVNV
jgi:murein DD-endopeptidase MepM/ murein hydrolase activator NlpD